MNNTNGYLADHAVVNVETDGEILPGPRDLFVDVHRALVTVALRRRIFGTCGNAAYQMNTLILRVPVLLSTDWRKLCR